MRCFLERCFGLLLILAPACSGTTTSPSPATASQTPIAFTIFLIETGPSIVLTGQVTDAATSAPIAGATVRINGRYSTSTDSSGRYSVTGFLDVTDGSATYVSADGYDADTRYIRTTTQNVRLRRIERMTAGDSKAVIVTPDDTLCYNNFQDPGLGSKFVCRSVHVVAPRDGVLMLEALSTQGGARPPVEVETPGIVPCCPPEYFANPTSFRVTAGTEAIVSVEIAPGATTSQSFILLTSLAPP